MVEWWDRLISLEQLQYSFYGNPLHRWLAAAIVFVIVLIVFRTVMGIVRSRARKVAERIGTPWAFGVVDLITATRFWFLLVLSVYLAALVLTLPAKTQAIVQSVAIIGVILQGALWGSVLISFWLNRIVRKRLEDDAASLTTMTALGFMGRVALWSLAILLILDNLGIDVTALIAGLGIGGVAVALAAQNVLGDLFASLAIVLDKPFVLGDFIIVGEFMGSVENIGVKTTRIRSISGEQLVFSNSDLLKSRIRNFKRMNERRVVFTIGVTYQTPADKLEAIPGMIREAIEANEQVRFDRSHFKAYADSALQFETVYYVTVPDYAVYMDIQQNINLTLYRRFAEEGIEFAYPTQTIFLHREEPAVAS